MRKFSVPNMSPADFVGRVEKEIRARDFQDIASINVHGANLVVRFSWMGTSTLIYCVTEQAPGFSAELTLERMSMFHAPFKARFEERFDRIMGSVGAEVG